MNDVDVQILVTGGWLSITRYDDDTYILGGDDNRFVTITNTRQGRVGRVIARTISFDMIDNNGIMDGDNPASPYYRAVGVGTTIRVFVNSEIRAYAEISSIEPSREDKSSPVIVHIQASGIFNRLEGESQQPVESVATRMFMDAYASGLVMDWWPMEDERDSSNFVSPIGSSPMNYGGETITLGGDEETGLSTARMATFSGSGFSFASVRPYTSTEHAVWTLWTIPAAGFANNTTILRVYFTGGTVAFIDLVYGTSDALHLEVYAPEGILLDSMTTFAPWLILGRHNLIGVSFRQVGANVDCRISTWRRGIATPVEGTDILASHTIGRVFAVTIGQESIADASVGQLIVFNDYDGFTDFAGPASNDPATGFNAREGETAGDRLWRLHNERGIFVFIPGFMADTEPMGPQRPGDFFELCAECADTDGGIWYESRDLLDSTYITRKMLYNRAPTAALTIAHVTPQLMGLSDTTDLANQVVMTREKGGSSTYTIPDDDESHWTTQAPPIGANIRPINPTKSLYEDSQTELHAAWEAHIRAWREKRYPMIHLNMARSVFTAGDKTEVLTLDFGHMVTIDTTGYDDAWVPYSEIRALVNGYTELANQIMHVVQLETIPADAYEVEMHDSGASTLILALDDNDTSAKIATSAGYPWSVSTEPYHLEASGQPFTVTNMVNDTAAHVSMGSPSYADNTGVTPSLPAGATVDVGQAVFAFCGRRQTGAGIVGATPAGWTEVARSTSNKWVLCARWYRTGVTAPVFTVSGGAAGDTVGGFCFAFSGLTFNVDINKPKGYSLGWVSSVNASAQNIAYPAFQNRYTNSVDFLIGIKDDDWTSVATVAGTIEELDSSTTTGSDMGLVFQWYNPGTPTAVAAGSFVVTGGASAVSEGIVVGLRCLQTATITRGIAGVAASIANDSAVRVWRMGLNGL